MSEVKRDILPKTVKPLHYDLQVFNIDVNANTFEGIVTIDLEVNEDTDNITLHAADLTFKDVKVVYASTKTESQIAVKETEFNSKNETAVIHLNEVLKAAPSAKAVLTINYSAEIKQNMNSFYRSDYKDKNGKDQVLLSTQFEATSARAALPSFDEPNLKASFQLTLTVAEDFTALSNTPVLSSKVQADGKKKGAVEASGLKVVKFQPTPVMSTYLLAWALGKLEFIESFTEKSYDGRKIPVRIYTQEGISEQGQFGLEVATKVVDFFSEAFDIDYALPKLDLINVPSYSHNAMENWGLITFRPTALLFDPKTSDPKYKKRVAYIVAHEIAHQWFGNLVTMDWWDELWLNEGFATWVGNYAIEHLFPEWRASDITTATELQLALGADASRNSHPVEVPIQSSSDIDQVFDFISYLKGGSVINQIARSLGVEIFLKGVSNYLKKNIYANGSTDDLLKSISEVSGVDVVTQGNNWIRKIGFPYVSVEVLENDQVKFTQHRFLSGGDATEEEDQTLWYIPLNISTGKEPSDRIEASLTERSTVVEKIGESFFKINKDSTGFYRVVYDSKSRESIKANIDKLSSTDIVGIVSDSALTAIAGLSKTSDALELIKLFRGSTDYVVWTTILRILRKIKSAWFERPKESQELLNAFIRELTEPTALSLGFTVAETDDYLTTQLRSELLKTAIGAGAGEIVEQAKSLFSKIDEIDPSLKEVVYQAVVSSPDATEEDFESVYNIINTSKAIETRELVLSALGSVTNEKLIQKSLDLILSPEIPIMDVQFVAIPLSKNAKAKREFWNYLKDNFDAIYERLNANEVVFERFIKFTLGRFASKEAHDEIKEFFKDKDTHSYFRALEQVLDGISANAAWVERDTADVDAFLKK
jgi:aminopeptidase N